MFLTKKYLSMKTYNVDSHQNCPMGDSEEYLQYMYMFLGEIRKTIKRRNKKNNQDTYLIKSYACSHLH